jgi:hypothetical protein
MPIQNRLRPLLHTKKWEGRTPSPVANTSGAFLAPADLGTQMARIFEVAGASAIYAYYGSEDAWVQLPNSGLGGTFGAGACGEFHPDGPSGTATGGTTTTFSTNLTIVRDLRGHMVRITAGPNAGQQFLIRSNTIGANAVITVTVPAAFAFTAASVFTLRTGRLFVFIPSATAPAFGFYDWALNTWTARSVAGLPTSFGTEGQIVGTDSLRSGALVPQRNSTGTNTATVLNDTGSAFTLNALSNLQIRITGGTGAGQVRRIASNTATAITVATAFTVTPDATSTYVVEGDDDALYLLGNAAVAVYKYSISGNSWSTLAPAVARAASPGSGMTADLAVGITEPDWNLPAAPLNGRYIYSFRGGGGPALDRYDIALNSWAPIVYGNQFEAFAASTNATADRERIYIQKDGGNRLFYFDVVLGALRPFTTLLYGVGAATAGDKLAILRYVDGSDELPFLYMRRSSGVEMFRIIPIE